MSKPGSVARGKSARKAKKSTALRKKWAKEFYPPEYGKESLGVKYTVGDPENRDD